MSGICDTCKRNQDCRRPMDGMDTCRLYVSGKKSNWQNLFGTPERAARTICRQLKHYNICICDGCPVKPPNKECDSEYDALLEWLKGEA